MAQTMNSPVSVESKERCRWLDDRPEHFFALSESHKSDSPIAPRTGIETDITIGVICDLNAVIMSSRSRAACGPCHSESPLYLNNNFK